MSTRPFEMKPPWLLAMLTWARAVLFGRSHHGRIDLACNLIGIEFSQQQRTVIGFAVEAG